MFLNEQAYFIVFLNEKSFNPPSKTSYAAMLWVLRSKTLHITPNGNPQKSFLDKLCGFCFHPCKDESNRKEASFLFLVRFYIFKASKVLYLYFRYKYNSTPPN